MSQSVTRAQTGMLEGEAGDLTTAEKKEEVVDENWEKFAISSEDQVNHLSL